MLSNNTSQPNAATLLTFANLQIAAEALYKQPIEVGNVNQHIKNENLITAKM